MRILIIGGHGTIGKRVSLHFKADHKVIIAGRIKGDVLVDISEIKSIQLMFEKIGQVDAIICIAGEAKWAEFDQLSEDDYYIGIKSKLMGQINIVRIGRKYLSSRGSITLTTGILGDDPVSGTTSAAMVNGALHSFIKAVNLEIENGIRINAVSLGVVEDSYKKYKEFFPGHLPISMNRVIKAYDRSVLGKDKGEIIRRYD